MKIFTIDGEQVTSKELYEADEGSLATEFPNDLKIVKKLKTGETHSIFDGAAGTTEIKRIK